MSVWFMPVPFWLLGTKFGRLSKFNVKLPCSPHAVGVAVAEDAGKGFEKLDAEVLDAVVLGGSVYGCKLLEADPLIGEVLLPDGEAVVLLLELEVVVSRVDADAGELTLLELVEVNVTDKVGLEIDKALELEAVKPDITLESTDKAAVEPLTGIDTDGAEPLIDGVVAGDVEGTMLKAEELMDKEAEEVLPDNAPATELDPMPESEALGAVIAAGTDP